MTDNACPVRVFQCVISEAIFVPYGMLLDFKLGSYMGTEMDKAKIKQTGFTEHRKGQSRVLIGVNEHGRKYTYLRIHQ